MPRARAATPRLVRHPAAFVVGAAAGVTLIALYLTATASWSAWWSWCIAWAAEHQRRYPGFSWRKYLGPILVQHWWVFALAALGLLATVRRLARAGVAAWSDGDVLLAIDDEAVPSVEAVQKKMLAITKARPRSVVLKVRRGIRTFFIELETGWRS